MKAQVTLFDKKGRYRPVSCLIKIDSKEDLINKRQEIKNAGVKKIMIQHGWTRRELIEYNFLTCKMRVYPEKEES